MDVVLVVVVLAVALLVIAGPLRGGRRADEGESAERSELEAAKAAKYAEIRDAELDRRTGKLSDGDWRAMDRQLRREAVDILHRLDELDDRDA